MKKHIFILTFLLFSLNCFASNSALGEPVKNTTRASTAVKQNKKAARWWLRRHQEKLTQKEQLGDVQVVFLGDSITHAWDKYQEPWNQYFAKYNALNIGFSGDRTENVLWRLENGAVDGIKPKVLVMMIGTNNAGKYKEASAETAIGVKAILQDLRQRLPKTKILMLAIFPRGKDDSSPMRQLTMGTDEIIKTYADDKNIFFMNINKIFLDDKRIVHRSVMRDFLHPSKDMYPKWAEAISPKITELMNQ
ncbi:GDSL-type esterase/lipase family protein [Lentisphaera marina]|uniref:GDSL-type esterase/lipase family protein n=1 Tax=Lentisphaera marina TaxID=1111041 RepID=UPI0023655428|nr:GDSL-type esterase/lipase family protein [Lentisphaera marina]MDD7983943.1 GDSL-type esterase/lipase family protein [Lentisphaera marina]